MTMKNNPPARRASRLAALAAALSLCACAAPGPEAVNASPLPAEPATLKSQQEWQRRLPFADRQDFEDAQRGHIAGLDQPQIRTADGRVAWDTQAYAFESSDEAPATVNPSLWRQALLNNVSGLFKVTERVYQVRGLDLANMTIVEGDTGIIIIDPLLSAETARAGLDLYYRHRPARPVSAVVYTHSHIDHFGGVRGVISEDDVKAGRVQVIAPSGFMEEAISENVLAGTAMSRRAQYMYGALLPRSATGQVDAGLGKGLSRGTVTLIAPSLLIEKPVETRRVDGVDIEFQLTPGTEAPSEMNLYFPQMRTL